MKIYLGTVVYRQVEAAYHQSVMLFMRECAKRGIEVTDGMVKGDALVSRSRSLVASHFLRSDCDVLLTIDSDIWFRAEDAIQLAEEALEYKAIGAMYMTRSIATQPAMMLPPEGVIFAANGKITEVPFISTGFMAVHRSVFEELTSSLPKCHQNWNDELTGMSLSFWPFYMPYCIPFEGDGYIYLSEDWAFCQRAKDAGYPMYIDPTIRLGHIGEVMYTLEDLIREPKPRPQPLILKRQLDGTLETYKINEVVPTTSG